MPFRNRSSCPSPQSPTRYLQQGLKLALTCASRVSMQPDVSRYFSSSRGFSADSASALSLIFPSSRATFRRASGCIVSMSMMSAQSCASWSR